MEKKPSVVERFSGFCRQLVPVLVVLFLFPVVVHIWMNLLGLGVSHSLLEISTNSYVRGDVDTTVAGNIDVERVKVSGNIGVSGDVSVSGNVDATVRGEVDTSVQSMPVLRVL
jgi:hypothetical protein